MKTKDFYFELPKELIAQHPRRRGTSRMLVYSRKKKSIIHDKVRNLPNNLDTNTLVLVNNTSVRKARVYGKNDGGSEVEFIFIHPLDDALHALDQEKPALFWRVMVNKAKRQSLGRTYTFPGELHGEIVAEEKSLRIIKLDRPIDDSFFSVHGHVPLPPYIQRKDNPRDAQHYQTIFASEPGSLAAPTAGLHITNTLLQELRQRGIQCCELTLHVGLGTFLPVRSENITDHEMHSESYEINEETAEIITEHKRAGGPVLAVGTTSMRCLESAWNPEAKKILHGRSSTNLFIYPGYTFKVVDALLTNFHTPKSSLLMLASAFIGHDTVLSIYQEAIKERYRFFSYGDACLFL